MSCSGTTLPYSVFGKSKTLIVQKETQNRHSPPTLLMHRVACCMQTLGLTCMSYYLLSPSFCRGPRFVAAASIPIPCLSLLALQSNYIASFAGL